jgi:hypothetical protein
VCGELLWPGESLSLMVVDIAESTAPDGTEHLTLRRRRG